MSVTSSSGREDQGGWGVSWAARRILGCQNGGTASSPRSWSVFIVGATRAATKGWLCVFVVPGRWLCSQVCTLSLDIPVGLPSDPVGAQRYGGGAPTGIGHGSPPRPHTAWSPGHRGRSATARPLVDATSGRVAGLGPRPPHIFIRGFGRGTMPTSRLEPTEKKPC